MAGTLVKSQGQEALLVRMMRPYIISLTPRENEHLHSPRKMRGVLEMIAPQAHEGDHETIAEILHNGSQESLAVELVRLLIYLDTNHLASHFKEVTGCNVNLSTSANFMDFLRRMGFLTKANIDWLASSSDDTSQAFLGRIVRHSIFDKNSFDVLAWLIPSHFDANELVQVCEHDYLVGLGIQNVFCRHEIKLREYSFSGTLLHASSLAGSIHAVTFLLDLGADPYDTTSPRNFSPLECAASLRHDDLATIIAGLLLSKKTRTSSEFQNEALEGALQLAMANAHTKLVMRLLTQRKRLGHGTICLQHLTTAAGYADCDTIRLLLDISLHGGIDSILLPEDILFTAVSKDPVPDRSLDKFKYLLGLGADPAVLGCNHGCSDSFLLCYVIVKPTRFHRTESERLALDMVSALRTHGCPSERPKSTSGGDQNPSALQLAIFHRFPLVVRFLLEWGANIDHYQEDVESQTSEHEVCNYNGSWTPDIQGRSPLLTALQAGEIEIAKMLFRQNPNLKLHGGEQKLAMKAGDDTELVAMLLKAGSGNVDEWKDFLEQAILMRNPRSTKLLLSMGHDIYTAIAPVMILRAAVLAEDQELAYQQITVYGYDSRTLFDAVVRSHASKDYYQIVERLLEVRPKTPNDDFEIVAVAAAAVHQDMYLMRVLMRSLGQGPWIAVFPPLSDSESQDTPMSCWVPDDQRYPTDHILDYAARHDQHKDSTVMTTLLRFSVPATGMNLSLLKELTAETLKQLIAAGADPQHHLFGAVVNNMLSHVKILCEAKVPLNTMWTIHSQSRTVAQLAVECASPEMLQLLLHNGADVGQAAGGLRGATCLQLAAGAGRIGLVRFFLHKGVKVNAKRSLCHGRTAIEIAAENGRMDVLKLLLLQKEQLYQTTAERYQFIRAARMAKNEGHAVINKMLREHINWNSEDQRLFDEIQDSSYLVIHLDDMTEVVLEAEKRDCHFWYRVGEVSREAGFEDIYDIDGIEQWIGQLDEERSYDSNTDGTDCSSEGDDSMTPENGVAASQFRTPTHEITLPAGEPRSQAELQSVVLQPGEILPAYEDIHNALVEPTDLQGELTGEQSARQWHAWTVNSETDRSTQTSAPQCLRYQDKNPVWLEMEDDDINNMMQDLSGGLITQDRTWEALAHRPAAQNVGRDPGMVLGEVPDEATFINDMGDDVFDQNEMGEIGEVEHSHVRQFNWGVWDNESFALHSRQAEDW